MIPTSQGTVRDLMLLQSWSGLFFFFLPLNCCKHLPPAPVDRVQPGGWGNRPEQMHSQALRSHLCSPAFLLELAQWPASVLPPETSSSLFCTLFRLLQSWSVSVHSGLGKSRPRPLTRKPCTPTTLGNTHHL